MYCFRGLVCGEGGDGDGETGRRVRRRQEGWEDADWEISLSTWASWSAVSACGGGRGGGAGGFGNGREGGLRFAVMLVVGGEPAVVVVTAVAAVVEGVIK